MQLREKSAPAPWLREMQERLAKDCAEFGASFLVNADLLDRIAPLADNAGVHYSSRTLPRRVSGFCGFSAHTTDEAQRAHQSEVAFCTISPIFETNSKPGLSAAGVELIRGVRKTTPEMPLIALGGINATNARSCIKAGAVGVAMMSGIMSADDPAYAARELYHALYLSTHTGP